ncbi:tetratricopeptide repeat protein [Reyranella sp.]|uniref:tetratricopeptide repeat protein n=1 Tax=Reyranella sp. TaxID=1929291 RepID=UPI0037838F44
MDQFRPTDLTPGLYYADGQQQAEVFAYGSFRQSRMYALGVTCMDCHDAHSGRLRAEGNAVCTQCHSPPGDRRFPSAARLFDDPSHHHHRPGSPGAACVNCHMPATNYMVVHSRPDHSLRLPRPDLSETLGTPNACTGCHADKPPRWAAEFVESWFAPDRGRAPSFAEALAAGRAGKVDAIPALDRLVDDTTLPAIVRATALDQLRAYGGAAADSATKALADPDPVVRRAAVAAMEGARAGTRLAQLSPVLSDPARAVRIEAARILASVPANDFDPKTRSSFEAALAEYLAAQRSSLDMPGSWLNLAVVAEAQGHPAEAERHYLAALKLDPSFTPARLNLARLNAASGKVKDAETVLRQGLARAPDQGELHYSLGLLLAEQGRLAEAATALAEAARLLPDRARVQYNYALALQQSGRRPQAETALLKAQSLAPTDRSIVYALAVFYSQDRRWQLAVSWAEKLVALDPADPQAQRFLAQLRASAEGDRRR